MKTRLLATMILAMITLTIGSTELAYGRGGGGRGGGGGGGRGGGGGFSGGGGGRPSGGFSGGSRPSVGSSPSYGRPAAARPSAPSARPSVPASRPGGSGRPSLPNAGTGSRPNIGSGNVGAGSRPSIQPGTLPNIGSSGSRPANFPGTGIGSGQGIGSGTGIANRPGTGQGNRAGVSQQPARLPGLGDAGLSSRLPSQGARVQDRMAGQTHSLEDRRSNLSDRMSQGREDWQQGRQDRLDDRQDGRNENREDWQNWADEKHDNYGDWYHGSWTPGAGWGYMWDNYPVAAAVGLTAWGVNRIGYGWGYSDYSNPYYGDSGSYDYSEPLVAYSDSGSAPTETAQSAAAPSESQPQPTDEGMTAFEEARTAFHNGDYATALTKLDTTLKTMPRDTVVHEFRGLVLFALKRYPESAAAIYAVLSAGPGWDWTTMISLYANAADYTTQLRALEEFAIANPKSADARFLLGYHYQTSGYAENASKQYKLALAQLPDDKLLKQLVTMTTPQDSSKKSETPPPVPAVPAAKLLTTEQLVGNWKASNKDASFQLDLAKDGSFTWSYMRGKKKQSVKGVFAIDQNNLALETEDGGGTMLAEIDFANPSQFKFKMIGGGEKDPGLDFTKG